MKTSNEDIIELNKNPLELFNQSFRSQATKNSYTRKLKKITCEYLEDVLHGTFENRVLEFVSISRKNPDKITSILLALSKELKKRTQLEKEDENYLNPSSFSNFFKPIKKLLDINGISIVWKLIYSTYPEKNNLDDGRGYSKSEIKEIVKFCNGSLEKTIVLVSSSSGVRVGGLSGLTWNDLVPVYKINNKLVLEIKESEINDSEIVCAILRVYRNSSEEYPALITPEAYYSIMDYKKSWFNETKNYPKPEEPLLKNSGIFVKPLTESAIRKRVERVLIDSGIRITLVKGKRRHEIPTMNGFRRFFNKVNKEAISQDSTLASLIKKEFMMSHTGLVRLDKNYFKTHIFELVEEYLNAVPSLTISNENRLRAENHVLRKEKSKLEEYEIKMIGQDVKIKDLEKSNEKLQKQNDGIKELKQKSKLKDKEFEKRLRMLEKINIDRD